MNISLTGRHVEITDALKEHVEEKLRRAFADFPRIESVRVVLNVEKYRHIAEILVKAPHHAHAEAREETHDMYLSIDGAIEKVLHQMRRWADKAHDHKAVGLSRVERATARPAGEPPSV